MNTDYSPVGYLYAVEVGSTSAAGQPLKIEVYDPAYVYNGDDCSQNNITGAQATSLGSTYGDPYADRRYQAGRTTWCTGDQNLAGNDVVTTYIVREPDDTPSDLSDNPAVCAISFDGRNPGSGNADVQPAEHQHALGRENQIFRKVYRQWFPICTVPSGQVKPGTYVVQVRTNADLSSPQTSITASLGSGAGSLERAANPIPATGGYNRYTIRAGRDTNLTTAPPAAFTGVSFSAIGNLPIYINQDSADRRVLPGPHHPGDGRQDAAAHLLGHGRRRQLDLPAPATRRCDRVPVQLHVHSGRVRSAGRDDQRLPDGRHHECELQRPQRDREDPDPAELQLRRRQIPTAAGPRCGSPSAEHRPTPPRGRRR